MKNPANKVFTVLKQDKGVPTDLLRFKTSLTFLASSSRNTSDVVNGLAAGLLCVTDQQDTNPLPSTVKHWSTELDGVSKEEHVTFQTSAELKPSCLMHLLMRDQAAPALLRKSP